MNDDQSLSQRIILRVDSSLSMPEWHSHIWPIVFVSIFAGIAFELAIYAILELRRSIYNRHRNLKYVRKNKHEHTRKNQAWRTLSKGQGKRWKTPLPAPPDFVDDLCKQWNKVHDSLEDMLTFGEMMIKLENYVDNSYRYNEDSIIVGRAPGIKGFISKHCSHIIYSSAMRYRMLALKSREVAKKQGKLTETLKRCTTIRELSKAFDVCLGVQHRHLTHPRSYPRWRTRKHNPQPAIFSLREQAHSDIEQLNGYPSQRQRYVDAILELAREFSVS